MNLAMAQKKDFLEMFQRAYGDLFGYNSRLLSFVSDRIDDFSTLEEAVKLIGSYNNFEAVRVLGVLKKYWPLVGSVQIGREGSPVLYISIPFWTSQTNGGFNGEPQPIAVETRRQLATDICDAFAKIGADEADIKMAGGVMINNVRVWWD